MTADQLPPPNPEQLPNAEVGSFYTSAESLLSTEKFDTTTGSRGRVFDYGDGAGYGQLTLEQTQIPGECTTTFTFAEPDTETPADKAGRSYQKIKQLKVNTDNEANVTSYKYNERVGIHNVTNTDLAEVEIDAAAIEPLTFDELDMYKGFIKDAQAKLDSPLAQLEPKLDALKAHDLTAKLQAIHNGSGQSLGSVSLLNSPL